MFKLVILEVSIDVISLAGTILVIMFHVLIFSFISTFVFHYVFCGFNQTLYMILFSLLFYTLETHS